MIPARNNARCTREQATTKIESGTKTTIYATEPMPSTDTRVPTGLPALDQEVGGGLPAGSLVAVRAPPSAPVELLLARFVTPDAIARGLYATTVTSVETIADQLASVADTDPKEPPEHVQLIDARKNPTEATMQALTLSSGSRGGDAPPTATSPTPDGYSLGHADNPTRTGTSTPSNHSPCHEDRPDTPTNSNREPACSNSADIQAVSDTPASDAVPVNDITAGRASDVGPVVRVIDSASDILLNDDVNQFLDQLASQTIKERGLSYLHLRIPRERPPTTDEGRLLHRVDVVMEYQITPDSDMNDRLAIPKLRRGTPPDRRLTLEVTDHIAINPDRRM